MNFTHDNEGLYIKHRNNSILINGIGISSPPLTDEEMLNFSKALLAFNQNLGRISSTELKPDDLKISKSKKLLDIHNPQPIFKYISKTIYDKYISKGQFQLGSSQYYREIEKNESRDNFEGFSITFLNINDLQIPISLFRCSNYLIFCGSAKKSSEYLKEKFGNVEMKICDSLSFGNKIAKLIGAKSFIIGKVEYSNSKICKSNNFLTNSFINPQDFINQSDVIEFLLSESLYPSMFVKPKMFEDEDEIRIIFEMQDDFTLPHNFTDLKLLDEIEFKYSEL